MKIAIIGAGFAGLSAANELIKLKHSISIFEKDPNPGGLAMGYKKNEWEWSLEKHYHHLFTNDKFILKLAQEIDHEIIIKNPNTSIFIKNNAYKFDSPASVIKFPLLSIINRLRLGFVVGFLKIFPFWKFLEKYNASKILPMLMGKKPYSMIWEPLFINKFGRFSDNVSLAWFWARIVKRTPNLCYPKGGFLEFAKAIVENIEKNSGKFYFNTEVISVKSKEKPMLSYKENNSDIKYEKFDAIIVTLPTPVFLKIADNLSEVYKQKLTNLKFLGAINLILRLKKPFLKNNIYWLNVCDKNSPVMAIVEHTNFMSNKNYNNEHLLYLGNYKEITDKLFLMEKEEILRYFDPYLKKINKEYSKNIVGLDLFKDYYAQPVIPVNYSKSVPGFKTPLKNVYLANMQQVYPWDRGTNYAVEIGKNVVDYIIKNETR